MKLRILLPSRSPSFVAEKFQVIVTSHSPFAMGVDADNWIEPEDGYLEACRSMSEITSSYPKAAAFIQRKQREQIKIEKARRPQVRK